MMFKVWRTLPEKAATDEENYVIDVLRYQVADDFRNILGLNVTKRLLNVFNPLHVKVHFSTKPERKFLRAFLKRYNFVAFKRIAKVSNTFAARVKTIADYDELINNKKIYCGAAKLTITPCYKFSQCPKALLTKYADPDEDANELDTSMEVDVAINDNIENNGKTNKPSVTDAKEELKEKNKPDNEKGVETVQSDNKNKADTNTSKTVPVINVAESKSEVAKGSNEGQSMTVDNVTKTTPGKSADVQKTPAKTATPVSKLAPQNVNKKVISTVTPVPAPKSTVNPTKSDTQAISKPTTTPVLKPTCNPSANEPANNQGNVTKPTTQTLSDSTSKQITPSKPTTTPKSADSQTSVTPKLANSQATVTKDPNTQVAAVKAPNSQTTATKGLNIQTTVTKAATDQTAATKGPNSQVVATKASTDQTAATKGPNSQTKASKAATNQTTATKAQNSQTTAVTKPTNSQTITTSKPGTNPAVPCNTKPGPKANATAAASKPITSQTTVSKTPIIPKTLPAQPAKPKNIQSAKGTPTKSKATFTKGNVTKTNKVMKPAVKEKKPSRSYMDKDDFEELDDYDILALMSGGIVLDECSGSEEE